MTHSVKLLTALFIMVIGTNAYAQTDTTRHNNGAVKTKEDQQEKKMNPDPSKSDTTRTTKPTSPGKKKDPKKAGVSSGVMKEKDWEMVLTDNLIIN